MPPVPTGGLGSRNASQNPKPPDPNGGFLRFLTDFPVSNVERPSWVVPLPCEKEVVMEDFDVVTGPSPSRMPSTAKTPLLPPSPPGEREKETTPEEPENEAT